VRTRHSLLSRQLKRCLNADLDEQAEWQSFLEAVNDAYHQSDIDRGMLERALDLSSEELMEANSELSAVVHAFPDLFMRLDSEGRILECKAGSQSDLLLQSTALVGKTFQSIPAPRVASRFERAIEEARTSGSVVRLEYSLDFDDRSEWYEARILQMRQEQLLAVIRNISNRKAAESALRLSEQEYRGLFETAHDAIILVSPATQRVIEVNRRACLLYGYSEAEFVGLSLADLVGEKASRNAAVYAGIACTKTADGEPTCELGSLEAIHRRKNGSEMLMDAHTSIVQYHGEKAILSINRDITAREAARKELESSLSLLQATLDSTADGILVIDIDGEVVAVNRRFYEMWRIPEPLIESRNDLAMLKFAVDQLSSPEAFMQKVRELYAQPDAESRDELAFKDGRVFERYSQPQRVAGASVGRVWSFRDITQQREAEAEVRRLAYYDELTGLPNRALLKDRLEQILADVRRAPRLLALLFLDLDRFKTINDTLGHATGDLLLQAVTERLGDRSREDETLARLGGDEFVLLIHRIRCPEDAAVVARRLIAALEEPFVIEGRALHVSASVGISVCPSDGDDAEALLTKADVAMYSAKERGDGIFQFYDPLMDAKALEKLTLENDMRHALRQDEFVVYYQPQVDLASGAVVAAEALLRWRKEDGTIVSPGKFIPLAEASGLIVPLGEHVLNSACRQAVLWQESGFPPIRLAVNVSARQLERRGFVSRVGEILRDTGFDPANLELELTESAILLDPDRAAETLAELRELGIGIALDDFGTGHSSLSNLSRLPIQTLKLDRSFVRSCSSEIGNRTIVTAVLAMARGLGLRVVAEGVETVDELCFLRDSHCDEVQGFYFCRPVVAEEFIEFARAGGLPLIPQVLTQESEVAKLS